MKVRTEAWRVVKFLLLTAAVYLALALVGTAVADGLTARGIYTGKLPWAFRDTCSALAAAVLVLLHRRITFRVHASLHAVLPVMVIGVWVWNEIANTVAEGLGAPVGVAMAALWVAVSYLLQRFGFYGEALRKMKEETSA